MQITKDTVVTLDYSVIDPDGNVVDGGEEPLAYLHGYGTDIFPVIESALDGKVVGDTLRIAMTADDAFGPYQDDLVKVEPRDIFPDTIEIGMQFETGENDDEESELYTIIDIEGDQVVLDANHPLAGLDLTFECTVREIRAASPEEIDHGHVH